MTAPAESYQKLLEGRRTPLQIRQQRYDSFLLWSRKGMSMMDIARRWKEETGIEITRQRVGKILAEPRPGTFSKGSDVAVLTRRVEELTERLQRWQRRDTQPAIDRVVVLRSELAEAKMQLRTARAHARKVSKVQPG